MTRNHQELAVSGIHHITAVAASAAENYRFYTRMLKLRLVKKTVNFDDPHTYHLYYGDRAGNPGTILTFFPWERLPRGKPGAGMVTAIAFAVPRSSMDYWRRRLGDNLVAFNETVRFDEPVIGFTDPHGLPLELVGTKGSQPLGNVDDGAYPETAIRGFHSATMLVNHMDATQAILTAGMGMIAKASQDRRHRFGMQDRQAPGHLLDVVVDPSAPQGRSGGGTVHHIAFRTHDDREQEAWQQRLRRQGLPVTDVRDRKYFRSIYFNEPGGVLFEIATDPPGFAVDEDPEHLGRALKLPRQYEPLRSTIEGKLPTLETPVFKHLFDPAAPHADTRETIVALHGTGGDEHDLMPLIRQITRVMPVISPRGKVLENGMPRFFKRLAEGIFDEQEVGQRADELADFLVDAAMRYRQPADGLVAVGYSNGANIAAAIMLRRPGLFSRAVLLRPMLPLKAADMPDLEGMPVLVIRGRFDAVIPAESTVQLVDLLELAGAQVKVALLDAGHEITTADVETARNWLSATQPRVPDAKPMVAAYHQN